MSEVRVTQVVAEVIVPFVAGNTTAAGVTTERFDAGEGSEWYICSSVVDSGVELLAKTIKGMRAIGKLTNASMMLFGYDIGDGIDVGDLETGTNSSTGPVALTDSTQVAQSTMLNINVTNSVLWAVRISGDDTGETVRDRVDELVVQVAEGGVRR
jgi:hypothetical protein